MSKKSTKALASATLMSLVLTTALSAGPVKADAGKVTRTSGSDRYATAASVATTNWKDGSNDVVLVSGEGYADAVSASALAKKLNAPILLTSKDSLSSDAKSALTSLKAKNVYVVGGTGSIAQSVRDELKNDGYSLTELGGANRYETNAKVAQKLVDLGVKADEVIMVGGEGFSDALSVAPIAAAKGQILLLGMNDADYMKPVIDFVNNNKSKVTVVGTENVINSSIYNKVNAASRVNGGSDRFDTNLKVLAAYKDTVKTDKLYVANASGEGYADALVASAVAGKTGAPLVLVDGDGSTATTNAISYIKTNATSKTDLNVIGGTGVVSQNTEDEINKLFNPSTDGDHTVKSIESVNLNEIKIHFNSAIDSDSAEDVSNYKIDGVQLKAVDENNKSTDSNCAVAKAIDDNTVTIVLAKARKQNDSVTVAVKNGIFTKDKSNTITATSQDVSFKDTEAPTVKNVTVEGNSQLTVEFSEAVDMQTISQLKSKFKIDGKSLGNVNTSYSKIKNKVEVDSDSYGTKGTWAYKVMFYFDSPMESGNHTLTIDDGDSNGALRDAAGWTFQETTKDFSVDTMTTKPTIKSIKETSSGEVHVTFDRPMDVQTALDPNNWELNDKNLGKDLSLTSSANFDTDDNDATIKITGLSDGIETGSNRMYIKNNIKDAYGNKVADDTRVSFDDLKDETKPTVLSVNVADSQTVNVRFSKDVKNSYARNTSNYKLVDNKGVDITDHIDAIYSYKGTTDTTDTDTYKIKIKRANPDDANDDWRLNSSNYSLTIKNIADTASTPNIMDDYTTTLNANDDVAPNGTGIFAKMRDTSTGKDKVVVYFSEPMDTATLTTKSNYQIINGKGDTVSLPSDASITVGGDSKSAIIEFPSSYNVKTTGKDTLTDNENDVLSVIVANVKDEAGNLINGVAYNNNYTIKKAQAGAKVKANTIKTYYKDGGDDLKVDVQFDKAIDEYSASDFTVGGVTPSSATADGDVVTLTFKDGESATAADIKNAGTITYANGATNTAPTKIELVKAQGQNAKLAVNSTGTTDETGALVSRNDDGSLATLSTAQSTVYDYQAAPRTTCFDNNDKNPDYWTATKDSNSGKVYITFDSPLDSNSGISSDDITFTGLNGTDLKADAVGVDKDHPNTVVFTFNSTNKNFSAFSGTLDVAIKSSISLKSVKDADGNRASYTPSSDDLKVRKLTVKDNAVAVTGVALDNTTLTLAPAGTATLAATVSPAEATNKNVTWTTSDASIATVDTTGKVTAVKDGTATITATTVDGSKTATCLVTVKTNTDAFIVSAPAPTRTLFGFTYTVTVKDGSQVKGVNVAGTAAVANDGYSVSGNTVTIYTSNNTDKVVILTNDAVSHAIN